MNNYAHQTHAYPQQPHTSYPAFPYAPNGDPSAFLNLDLSQPGPSSYESQVYAQTRSDSPITGHSHVDTGEPAKPEEAEEEGEADEAEAEADYEEPLYVNAKQYHRILKRRIARQRLEELNRLSRSRKVSINGQSALERAA